MNINELNYNGKQKLRILFFYITPGTIFLNFLWISRNVI